MITKDKLTIGVGIDGVKFIYFFPRIRKYQGRTIDRAKISLAPKHATIGVVGYGKTIATSGDFLGRYLLRILPRVKGAKKISRRTIQQDNGAKLVWEEWNISKILD